MQNKITPTLKQDATLPRAIGERHAPLQALKDAIQVRSLLLRLIRNVQTTVLQIYRRSSGDALELIVRGKVHRGERAPAAVRSLAMRAKLYGFQFGLDDGVLEPLPAEKLQLGVCGSVATFSAGEANAL